MSESNRDGFWGWIDSVKEWKAPSWKVIAIGATTFVVGSGLVYKWRRAVRIAEQLAEEEKKRQREREAKRRRRERRPPVRQSSEESMAGQAAHPDQDHKWASDDAMERGERKLPSRNSEGMNSEGEGGGERSYSSFQGHHPQITAPTALGVQYAPYPAQPAPTYLYPAPALPPPMISTALVTTGGDTRVERAIERTAKVMDSILTVVLVMVVAMFMLDFRTALLAPIGYVVRNRITYTESTTKNQLALPPSGPSTPSPTIKIPVTYSYESPYSPGYLYPPGAYPRPPQPPQGHHNGANGDSGRSSRAASAASTRTDAPQIEGVVEIKVEEKENVRRGSGSGLQPSEERDEAKVACIDEKTSERKEGERELAPLVEEKVPEEEATFLKPPPGIDENPANCTDLHVLNYPLDVVFRAFLDTRLVVNDEPMQFEVQKQWTNRGTRINYMQRLVKVRNKVPFAFRSFVGSEYIQMDERIIFDPVNQLVRAQTVNLDMATLILTIDRKEFRVNADNTATCQFVHSGEVHVSSKCSFLQPKIRSWTLKSFQGTAKEFFKAISEKLESMEDDR